MKREINVTRNITVGRDPVPPKSGCLIFILVGGTALLSWFLTLGAVP